MVRLFLKMREKRGNTMIRIAKESDLSAVAAVYEAILDHEDANRNNIG